MTMQAAFGELTFAPSRANAAAAMRLVLLPGELFKVSGRGRTLRVLSGVAWVSDDRSDHLVAEGDRLGLETAAGPALVSDADGGSLLIELR